MIWSPYKHRFMDLSDFKRDAKEPRCGFGKVGQVRENGGIRSGFGLDRSEQRDDGEWSVECNNVMVRELD